MENVQPNDLWTFLIVFLAICAAIVTVGKAISTVREWRKPSTDVRTMLATDKRRLDKLEAELDDLKCDIEDNKEGMRQMCAGVVALLNHELHDGNSDEMEEASRSIYRYLQGKI